MNADEKAAVVSYGAGVNSTAMLCGFVERGIVPSLILFADTGGEMPQTYEQVERVSAWCVANGLPAIETVRKLYRGKFEGLERASLRLRTLPGLAFGSRSCSMKYKGEPLDRRLKLWAKEVGAALPVTKAIGYGADEPHRAQKVSAHPKLWKAWYPLVEWGWDRAECSRVAQRHGLPIGKSSCFFCPAMKGGEVLALRRHYPHLYERAALIEATAQATTNRGLGGVGRHWSEIVKADEAQQKLFESEERNPWLPCGCM